MSLSNPLSSKRTATPRLASLAIATLLAVVPPWLGTLQRHLLEQVLEQESLSWLMTKLNIPFPAMRDTASTEISRMTAKNIEQLTGGNTAAS